MGSLSLSRLGSVGVWPGRPEFAGIILGTSAEAPQIFAVEAGRAMVVTQGSIELLLILIIVVIVFGTGKLADLAAALRQGIREFRKARYRQGKSQGQQSQEGRKDSGSNST